MMLTDSLDITLMNDILRVFSHEFFFKNSQMYDYGGNVGQPLLCISTLRGRWKLIKHLIKYNLQKSISSLVREREREGCRERKRKKEEERERV